MKEILSTNLSILTGELHHFLSQIQRINLKNWTWLRETRERCRALTTELNRLCSAVTHEPLVRRIESVATALQAYDLELGAGPSSGLFSPSRRRLHQAYRHLANAYGDLSNQIQRNFVILPNVPTRIKTMNYSRSIFHLFAGTTAFICYQFFFNRTGALWVLGTLLTIFGTLEITRRIWPRWNDFLLDHIFRTIAQPFERHHINSSTYFLVGVTLAILAFQREAALLGVVVLTLADPFAMLVGRRLGRVRILGEKTLEGTAAFFGMAAVAGSFYLLAFAPPEISLLGRLAIAFSTALVGSMAELFSKQLDDNLTITLTCAAWAAIWL